MSKSEIYQQEHAKLTEIFADVEEGKRRLVEGLVEDAAFLRAENYELKQTLKETGMVSIHPQHKQLQKPVEAARQYLKNVNSYSMIIKTLNGVLSKNVLDEDDGLDQFE